MQLSEYIRMSLSEIRRNLVRSVLTILGIVIGALRYDYGVVCGRCRAGKCL